MKLPLYGRTGVPEVWIVNLDARVVEVYAEPYEAGYRVHAEAGPGEVLRPRLLPSVAVPVDEILV